MVYGLRYYYRLIGLNQKAIALPSLKKEAKLPVILNLADGAGSADHSYSYILPTDISEF
jgi:hypothetical protein